MARTIGAAVTAGMAPQDVADICGVPEEDVLQYGNGYARLASDAQVDESAVIASPKEGVEPQEGESEAPKPKRKKAASKKKEA